MAKIDRVKEFISYLKVLLIFLLATSIGLIGWLVNNYNTAEIVLVYVDVFVILLIFIIAIFLNKKIVKDIKSLEDL
jgi:membrane protein YdbS with pleckstrin-like domain